MAEPNKYKPKPPGEATAEGHRKYFTGKQLAAYAGLGSHCLHGAFGSGFRLSTTGRWSRAASRPARSATNRVTVVYLVKSRYCTSSVTWW